MYHEIVQNLYLGNQLSTTFSESIGIDYIISIGSRSKEQHIENFHVGLIDDKTLDISDKLDVVTSLIDKLLNENKKISIHCKAGINRSPSFVLAYLCKYKNIPFDEVIAYILVKRKICRFSFKNQVEEWLSLNN